MAAADVPCDVLGHDRWDRALGACFAGAVEVNRELVRRGWAPAWYPERSAVGGPSYDAEEFEVERAERRLGSESFIPPRECRRKH